MENVKNVVSDRYLVLVVIGKNPKIDQNFERESVQNVETCSSSYPTRTYLCSVLWAIQRKKNRRKRITNGLASS